jgi:hypothetical protein
VSLPQIVILLFGIVVCGISIWAIFVPERLLQMIMAINDKRVTYLVAVGVRLLLGVTLVLAAPDSAFPGVFEVIGWLTIFAAVILSLLGKGLQRKLAAWFSGLSRLAIRGWLLLAIAFGLFLVAGVAG